MDHYILVTIATTIFLLVLTNLPQSHCEENEEKHRNCSRPYNCGVLRDIYYPFWDGIIRPQYCGGGHQFKLSCEDYTDTWIQLKYHQDFLVHSIHPLNYTIIMMEPIDLITYCSPDLGNTSLDPTLFNYTENVHNITIFFNCPSKVSINASNFTCPPAMGGEKAFYVYDQDLPKSPPQLNDCGRRIQVQASRNIGTDSHSGIGELEQALSDGFEVKYTVPHFEECIQCLDDRKGACGINEETHEFECYPPGSQSIASAVLTALLICIIIFCSRYKSQIWQVKFCLTIKRDPDIETFLKIHGALAPKRYKFSEVKKMTNSFKVKLGQGGFGAVYKGKLPTGRPVAVKLLNASKGNGEDFMNEVASISRTSHVNVVTLVGFCLEGRKKALIYEFMANGSLDKFIYKKGQEAIASLSWESLYQIAIGIARGLEYLHRGCNTRILHFDIKPHNILLDENFCPKISDFGLAKLCPRKESIVSMSDPRGTFGFLAPEMWNRRFGGVSHKSDVYSYGMILLDMVEGRNNTNNVQASHSSEMYFLDCIYNRLEQRNLRPHGAITPEENEFIRRMTVVGLWCIQTLPNDRPTITKVIDMLQVSLSSLEIPPKPVLSSPTRSIQESSTT
ncbi:hypothetical protein VNO77_33104 [Canavalia gladiata]|uniref:non-specific serine/threonine protein kinase n=1 Tax=Canavalia gladiata TaxID=3824 RepID=A0AAN9KE31_CANGL